VAPLAMLGFAVFAVIPIALIYAAVENSRAAPGRRPESAIAGLAMGAITSAAAIGFLLLPWFEARRARRTVYALTGARVMRLTRNPDGRVATNVVEPGHPLAIARKEYADGSGDVLIYPMSGSRAQLVLAATPRPREVERLIRSTFDPPVHRG
jgi:hypothetical protein